MVYRILHCGKSLENYEICIRKKIVGFLKRSASSGDRIYLAVKVKTTSFCSVRGILGDVTDLRPWEDGNAYIHCLNFINLEFCEPFELKILAEIGGQYWSLKYLQSAKPITDRLACDALDRAFKSRVLSEFKLSAGGSIENSQSEIEYERDDLEKNILNVNNNVPESNVLIMGTFQTVKFSNETDKIRGLEVLVNRNFYELFADYQKERTLLISENRLFLTAGVRAVSGICAIPDALLLIYDRQNKPSLRIN
ncbi:MAG: hypothetical protein J7641_04550 [Cyanobacteria bacterium SID2]|nr:hypothetical protein [Cyanobacteria bacterium SID2]